MLAFRRYAQAPPVASSASGRRALLPDNSARGRAFNNCRQRRVNEAVEFLEDHDLPVLILPDRSGFPIFRTARLNWICTLALSEAFE